MVSLYIFAFMIKTNNNKAKTIKKRRKKKNDGIECIEGRLVQNQNELNYVRFCVVVSGADLEIDFNISF